MIPINVFIYLHMFSVLPSPDADILTEVKGTHTVYFSSSFYLINQKPVIHRTDFHCVTTWVECFTGWKSVIHLLILWFHVYQPDGAIIQYKHLNIVYFDCKTTCALPGKENIFLHKKFLSTMYTQQYQ